MSDTESTTYQGWCVVEMLGHRVLRGLVTDVEIAGAKFLRVDIPGPDAKDGTHTVETTCFVAPSALYCLTPTTEQAIRDYLRPAPIQRYLPPPKCVACGRPKYANETSFVDGVCPDCVIEDEIRRQEEAGDSEDEEHDGANAGERDDGRDDFSTVVPHWRGAAI